MPLDPIRNFGKVTVSTLYDSSATSIELTQGGGGKLPTPQTDGSFNITWYNSTTFTDPSDDPNVEIVRCTYRDGNTLTVIRGQEGTSATNKNTAAVTYKMVLGLTLKMISDIQGYLPRATTVTDSTYSPDNNYSVYFFDATSNSITVTLPLASSYRDKVYVFKKIDSSGNVVTINRSGSDLIDGASSWSLSAQYNAMRIVSNGTNWYIINQI